LKRPTIFGCQCVRRLIREKQTADHERQKALRGRMRRIGFYISDFAADYSGFVVSDLDELISRGTITVKGGEIESAPLGSPPSGGTPAEPASDASMEEQAGEALASYVRDAIVTLGQVNALPLTAAEGAIPDRPGLYAIYASPQTWRELGLGNPPDGRPLYVGKAEDSLVRRDLKTHFGDGRTGHSTVRRSFAALLHDAFGLRGIPRNPAKPGYFSNYGLSVHHDRALTSWMTDNLELATWPRPSECTLPLKAIETKILNQLKPPLNLQDVVTAWTAQLKATRAVMADEARAWAG
jgi:GIY-YIG catalytic domain